MRTVREAFKTERGNLSKMQRHPFNVERSDRSGMHGREGADSGRRAPGMPWGESFNLERSDRSMLKGSPFIVGRFAAHRVHCAPGAEHTKDYRRSRPVRAALSRPDLGALLTLAALHAVMGRMGHTVRMAAWRNPMCSTSCPPDALEQAEGGLRSPITEPEPMTTRQAGNPGALAAPVRANSSRFYMLRLARRLAKQAAQKRQQDGAHTFPAPAHKRHTLSLPARSASTQTCAQRIERLRTAAQFLAHTIANLSPVSHANRCMVSPRGAWGDGSLDQALQALNAGDPRQAVKLLNLAMEQTREPLDTSEPDARQAQSQRKRIAQAIRTTRLMMANPQHCPSVQPVGAPALSLLDAGELSALLNKQGGAA
jgi:hypothetical protein